MNSYAQAGIFKQSMGARNRVGIGLSYRPARIHTTAWRNWFFGIDSWTPLKFKNSGSEWGGGGYSRRTWNTFTRIGEEERTEKSLICPSWTSERPSLCRLSKPFLHLWTGWHNFHLMSQAPSPASEREFWKKRKWENFTIFNGDRLGDRLMASSRVLSKKQKKILVKSCAKSMLRGSLRMTASVFMAGGEGWSSVLKLSYQTVQRPNPKSLIGV